VESLDQGEDHLIVAATTDEGQTLDVDSTHRLLTLPGRVMPQGVSVNEVGLSQIASAQQIAIQQEISERNAGFFEAEAEKLDGWADDLKLGLEREIKELDRQIKEARRAAAIALTLHEKLAAQKQIKSIEAQRNQRRRTLFDAQDQVDSRREQLIAEIEGKLPQEAKLVNLFTVRWVLQ
jgi:chromosome segregation ATPase